MSTVFAYLGWTWLLVALGTTSVALALAAWRTWRPADTPQAQHRLALCALGACVAVLALAPLALMADGGQHAPPASPAEASLRLPAAATAPGRALPRPILASTQTADMVARAVGALWTLGVVFMLTRLGGGWLVVRQLAGRARPSDSLLLRGAVDRLRAKMRVLTPVRIRESAETDVPIILGFSPVLIVPPQLALEPAAVTLEPLLAHELAHVVRRDYLLNMVQSVVDAVLVAFPGAQWISARIRETREYCCDEIALQVCGDRRGYVEALAGIAMLSVARQPVTALGVGGPRLATRIRRLLHGDLEVRHRHARVVVMLVALSLLLSVGGPVLGQAASQVVRLETDGGPQSQHAVAASSVEVTMSYVFDQPGSAVELTHAVAGGATAACDWARVRNNANVTVTGLAFVAVVTLNPGFSPVRTYASDVIPVNVAAGSEADVNIHLFSQADQIKLGAISPKIQVMCALTKVTYANGAAWEITPNPSARTADAALSLPPAEVPRSLVSAGVFAAGACRDDRGGAYSAGAIVPIRNEPGTFAECALVSQQAGERTVWWRDYGPISR